MGDKITTGEKWEQNFGSRKPENETGKKQINLHHRTPPSPPPSPNDENFQFKRRYRILSHSNISKYQKEGEDLRSFH